jgi:hypothetical protein
MSEHDPGGKRRIRLTGKTIGSAVFSDDKRCRFVLEREMIGENSPPYALWVGMNPSTADANVDDPTIRREWTFTLNMGLRRMVKMNVSPYRATFPRDIVVLGLENEYFRNMECIIRRAKEASIVIMASGVVPASIRPWFYRATSSILSIGRPIYCLGLTKGGFPRHPLYVATKTKLIEFDGSSVNLKRGVS